MALIRWAWMFQAFGSVDIVDFRRATDPTALVALLVGSAPPGRNATCGEPNRCGGCATPFEGRWLMSVGVLTKCLSLLSTVFPRPFFLCSLQPALTALPHGITIAAVECAANARCNTSSSFGQLMQLMSTQRT